MGHANTTCLISGITIGHQKVVAVILAPTKSEGRLSNALLSENKHYYPITMPIIGTYSNDEFTLDSYESSPWVDNLVDYFRKGVKPNKQKDFDLLALLSCFHDLRYDNLADRCKWFDTKKPNEQCNIAKTLDVAFIDYEVFENLREEIDEKEEKRHMDAVLRQVLVSLEIIKDYRKKKEKEIYWQMFHMENKSHDLFLEINEPVMRKLFDLASKKTRLETYVHPISDLLTATTWLFNLGRPWIPASWSHQDGEDENVLILSKIVAKVLKKKVGY